MRPSLLHWLKLSRLSVVIIAASVSSGCGGADVPKTTPVTGKVAYKGSPLTKGSITFTPIGKGLASKNMVRHPATSGIGPDGTYSLGSFTADDGAVPGDYAVMVASYKNDPTDEEISKGATYESAIPAKFSSAQTSPLKATVPEDGSLEKDFELK
jgi:hypothetical protein